MGPWTLIFILLALGAVICTTMVAARYPAPPLWVPVLLVSLFCLLQIFLPVLKR